MTDPMMTLQSLLAKSSDAEFLRSMIKTVAKAGRVTDRALLGLRLPLAAPDFGEMR